MKSFLTLLLISFLTVTNVSAQFIEADGGGAVELPKDHLSDFDRVNIIQELQLKIDSLTEIGILSKAKAIDVELSWPVRAESNLFDFGYHGISNFVDLNSAFPNQVTDYMCNSRSYDRTNGYNHAGTDIFTWPFSWNKMDNEEVAVIAAAPGVIILKSDGNQDRSCSFNSSQWNAVYVRHADGSVAWYGHLKKNSTINKEVGETVEAGEYLGIVGSSGNSTGPHLHFELQDENGFIVDPFKGACNQITKSLWKQQPDYYDSGINALKTQSAGPIFNQCPQPEEPNFKDAFLRNESLITAAYYRDQLQGQTTSYKISTPSNGVFRSWNHASNEVPHYAASYWWWNYSIPANAEIGIWKFEAIFLGITYEHQFSVSDQNTKPISVYLQFPENDIEIVDTNQNLRWLPLADADSYELLVASDVSFTELIVDETGLIGRDYKVENLEENTSFYWKVRAKNSMGTGDWSEVREFNTDILTSSEEGNSNEPEEFSLSQNYPNPFNPTTRISYKIKSSGIVQLKVYNTLGKEVASLVNSFKSTGTYSITFDASNLPSGIYYYKLQTPGFLEVKPMTLIK